MSVYTGKTVTVPLSQDEVYAKVSDLSQYKDLAAQAPAEVSSYLNGLEFLADGVKLNVPAIGAILFRLDKLTPSSHVSLRAEGTPVPVRLSLDLADVGDGKTALTPKIDAEIPMMLRPMVGGKLQEAADKFGDLFGNIFKK